MKASEINTISFSNRSSIKNGLALIGTGLLIISAGALKIISNNVSYTTNNSESKAALKELCYQFDDHTKSGGYFKKED